MNAISSLKESIDVRAIIFSVCSIVNDSSWKSEVNQPGNQQSFECDHKILQNKKDKSNKEINIKTMHTRVSRFFEHKRESKRNQPDHVKCDYSW